MRKSLAIKLRDNATDALVASIEAYNKPAFPYREETFAVLALNAWELLLKAKILSDARNRLQALHEYQRRPTKRGSHSARQYLVRNRSGNPKVIGLTKALVRLEDEGKLPVPIRDNLLALAEIRDNAVHFVNSSHPLSLRVLEVGAATIKNFVTVAKKWFRVDLSSKITFLMPLGFLAAGSEADTVHLKPGQRKLLEFLSELGSAQETTEEPDLHVALRVDVRFHKSKLEGATPVVITTDPTATKVQLSEEDIRARYPWTYDELLTKCRARYANFIVNEHFHRLRRPLAEDPRYVHQRYLDPANKKSGRKDFYSQAVLSVFDAHYSRRA